ncbi:MAG: Na/Pi cotransporter family protein [Clostridiales bacterium]|nr:Na/Pi cotransporter family protein [Clostridiales bacterium]
MDVFNALSLVGGLCLFLFGMSVMGQALERRAGNKLQSLLGKLTTGKFIGLLTGLGVTAVIQSSSATTVMVVGFVNSGLMSLSQSINVIMGANIGTTVTSWILSLGGIDSGNMFVKLLKPTSFTPILALLGIIWYMFAKSSKKKDNGMILLGFAVLMFGMDTMSASVKGLADVPAFQQLFLLFENPLLGMLVGAVLTAIIQSSSASVGILQALAVTGQVSYGAAIPIIMGQNIGTCITAILSSFGANKNAKRAALVHLSFNVIGTIVWLVVFWIVKAVFAPALFNQAASLFGIAVCHSIFNVLCTSLMLPLSSFLEKLVYHLVPEGKAPETYAELDERLIATPFLAIERAKSVTVEMARCAQEALTLSLDSISNYSPEADEKIKALEEKTDHYEDILGTYLVKLCEQRISESDNAQAAMLLKVIGDFERIGDHAAHLAKSAAELKTKELSFSAAACQELAYLTQAAQEIMGLALKAFEENDLTAANQVEPLEQVIDRLKEHLRTHHILRLQQGGCSIEAGFIWADLLANLERVSDHCSNVAGGIIDLTHHDMNIHEALRHIKSESPLFKEQYAAFAEKYLAKV